MYYTDHDKLTIIELDKATDVITFQQIGTALKERPANVIYCELDGKLYGVVSMGDVKRAKSADKKEVRINRMFTSVTPNNEYMQVRQIFKDKSKINAIPVVDENGRLMGNYVRWDDLLALGYGHRFMWDSYAIEFWKENSHVALVEPCDIFPRKKQIVEEWKSVLENIGVRIVVIDRVNVPEYFEKVDLIIYADEDERRGGGTLISDILDEEFVWGRTVTYKKMMKRIASVRTRIKAEAITEILISIKSVLGADGHILTLQFDSGSEYIRTLCEEMRQKFISAGVPVSSGLPMSARRDFFDEVYTEKYAKAVTEPMFRNERKGYSQIIKDISGEYHNVKNGERFTVGQPDEYNRTIYLFGPCVILGSYVEDGHTIASFLQTECNSREISCRVVNLGCNNTALGTLDRVAQTVIRKGDIIVADVLINEPHANDIDCLSISDVLEEHNASAKWFVDGVRHCNHKVNKIIADAIYDKLKSILRLPIKPDTEMISIDKNIVVSTYAKHYFKSYFAEFNPEEYGTIGSIIMNCNPFTNGHRYLIERALEIVDFLIIFVVEADQSFFTFNERFALVNAGVSDLQNIMVVPSGQLILSQNTFPEYFRKEEDENLIQNVEYDITLFADQVASRLNITYRFVGEEPMDRVTDAYNQAMKRILPQRGINVVEIPRKENTDGVISASRVRECLEQNNFVELRKLVPTSTMEILGVRM